nr:uncharacterized protein LOC101238615 [Hydra vulgaris]
MKVFTFIFLFCLQRTLCNVRKTREACVNRVAHEIDIVQIIAETSKILICNNGLEEWLLKTDYTIDSPCAKDVVPSAEYRSIYAVCVQNVPTICYKGDGLTLINWLHHPHNAATNVRALFPHLYNKPNKQEQTIDDKI